MMFSRLDIVLGPYSALLLMLNVSYPHAFWCGGIVLTAGFYCSLSTAYVLTEEISSRDLDSQALALSDMISSVLPPDSGGGGGGLGCSLSKKDKHELAVSVLSYLDGGRQENLPFELEPQNFHSFFQLLQNGSAESSESASTSSIGSNHSSHNKAPGSQLQQKHNNSSLLGVVTAANCNGGGNVSNQANNSLGSLQSTLFSNGGTAASSLLSNSFPDFTPEIRAQVGEQMKLVDNFVAYLRISCRSFLFWLN